MEKRNIQKELLILLCLYLDVSNFGVGLGFAINRRVYFLTGQNRLASKNCHPQCFPIKALNFVIGFSLLPHVNLLWNWLSKGNSLLWWLSTSYIWIFFFEIHKLQFKHLICVTASKSISYSSKDHFIICKTMKLIIVLWAFAMCNFI